ncbi:BamA/TamA family outer membrane protein [Lewinella sp. 4G2]|uniref:BamA/TamA family outer membrane protein n=1 Tax=Lewinella sp. 4G2 TaxID=1803372 RepID=UPI0007B497FB|nr:BamA/TamA family outer membrane protein [Lewinella sp. 4G2]OAV46096.1 hypothetical protein A3850_017695 [Lewinella sp. 4G2]
MVAGNTAEASPQFYRTLDQRINAPGDPATVLLLGDYIDECSDKILAYKKGSGNDAGFAGLEPLLQLIRTNPETKFYLLPGDRDWDKSGREGLTCVKAIEDYFKDQDFDNLRWPLANGCPGPEFVDLAPTTRLMLINTQWWNHPHDKPVPADANCDFSDPSISLAEILSGIDENQDLNTIIAGHYPPKSQGRYGGEYPARDHFAPPIIGSFRLSFRQNIGTPEELTNRRFDKLGSALRDYNSQYLGLMWLGAQDLSQQFIKFGNNHIVNAGAAGEGKWAAKHKPAIHVSRVPGFTELHYAADGTVNYRYVLAEDGTVARQELIYHAPCDRSQDTLPTNPAFPPCNLDSARMRTFLEPLVRDTIVRPAGPQYGRSKFGKYFLGKHYRDIWTTPVAFPILNLDDDPRNFTPIREGGGRQTTSLRLQAADGKHYTFRSVDKDPAGTFNYQVRETLIGDAVRDQTTTGHPFGGLIIDPLLNELDILHAAPELFVLSSGETLGSYNPTFGGMLGTLEISPRGDKKKANIPGTFGADKVLKSFELFRERYDDQEVLINHEEFLRARIFDLLVGDWSRHEDNWKWALFKQDDVENIRPIPRDRDNAFSQMDGFFPWLADRRWAIPNLEDFDYDQPDIRSLTFQARHMDRLLLSPLSRPEFLRQAQSIQAALTDEVLAQAVQQNPAPAAAQEEENERYRKLQEGILSKLKTRRDDLEEYADAYYELHAKTVDIVGTNDEEHYLLAATEDGRLTVTTTDVKGKSAGKILYQRTFLPRETKEVRIYGLADDDVFETSGPVGKAIRVRIIGGEGDDEYQASDDEPRAPKVLIYDKTIAAPAELERGFRSVRNWRPELYYYDRTAFAYNETTPIGSIGFNSRNGASLGAGFKHTRRNFTHRKFSSRYKAYVEGSTLGNATLEASAEFGQFIQYIDLVFATRVGRPDFYNFFFGIGNDTRIDPEVERNEFSLIALDHFSFEGGLRRGFADNSTFNLMLGYQNNKTTDRDGTILDRPERFYGDGDFVFGYLQPSFVFDLRDHPVFPSKGVYLEASHKQAFGRKNAVDFGVTRVAGEIHFSARRFPISLSLRGGYARSSGRAPFYELPSLGQNNGLRGFQRNRFVGDGYLYHETEFRMPVALIRSRVIPFAVGIRAFYDRGQLLMDDEKNEPWRTAYGGGFYVIPLSKSFTFSVLAGFSEEESGLIQFGVGTNF